LTIFCWNCDFLEEKYCAIVDSNGIIQGFVEEVTNNSSTHQALVGVLFFKKTSKPILENFDQEWDAIFKQTHK